MKVKWFDVVGAMWIVIVIGMGLWMMTGCSARKPIQRPVVQQAMVLAPYSYVSLSGQKYAIGVAANGGPYTIAGGEMRGVAASTLCAISDRDGLILVSNGLTLRQQAKALVHETTHVGLDCDKRPLAPDERVAEAMADLLESSLGKFVVEGLKR